MFAPFYIPLCGDATTELAKLEPQSVQCCITSPPYYGLRDYGVERQIGLEETPEQYIERLADVFAGVQRVLRDDGTLWIVIGDSYFGGGYSHRDLNSASWNAEVGDKRRTRQQDLIRANPGRKPKDLLGIPWLLAFALRDAGWYLRQEIIWAKSISGPVYRGGSCMPESVTDRCTRSHETVFMFSKSERYFYDTEAVKEESIMKPQRRLPQRHSARDAAMRADRVAPYKLTDVPEKSHTKRNMRSVWHVNPRPFKEAHFATFPSELIEPMVLVSSRPGDMVLDPFSGAGTTALVSLQHGRNAIGIELNPEYIEIARKRLWAAEVL